MANEIPEGYTELAQVGLAYGGIWNNDDYFDRNIFVDHNGDLWLCLQANSGNEPVAGSDYWHILVSRDEATEERIGMVRLSSRTDIEKIDGIALPAMEKNPKIKGTLAENIKNTKEKLEKMIEYKGIVEESALDEIWTQGRYNIVLPANGSLVTELFQSNSMLSCTLIVLEQQDFMVTQIIIPATWQDMFNGNVLDNYFCIIRSFSDMGLSEWKKIPSTDFLKSAITRLTSVTVEGQKALDAIENNPSIAGTIANKLTGLRVPFYTELGQLGLSVGASVGDIFNAMPKPSYLMINADGNNISDIPLVDGLLVIEKKNESRFSIIFKRSFGSSASGNAMYIGNLKGLDGSGLIWNKVMINSDITSSVSVTETGQKVLDAREKNPSIAGTLANSISQINSDLAKLNNSLTDSFVISGLNFHVEYSIGNDLFNIWANGNTNAGINASSWTSAHTLKGNMVAKMQEKNQPYRFGIMQIHTYRGITSIRWYINSSGSVAYYVISGEIYANENVQASVVF